MSDDLDKPVFTVKDIDAAKHPLVAIMRGFFVHRQITVGQFLKAYEDHFKQEFPDRPKSEFTQKAAVDRKFILDDNHLTFSMMRNVLNVLGFKINAVEMTIGDEKQEETYRHSNSTPPTE